jgi:hypothetical protein
LVLRVYGPKAVANPAPAGKGGEMIYYMAVPDFGSATMQISFLKVAQSWSSGVSIKERPPDVLLQCGSGRTRRQPDFVPPLRFAALQRLTWQYPFATKDATVCT